MKTNLTLFVAVFAVSLQHGYTQSKADLKKGLVAHYSFNGSGKDESGNGHLITVSGAILTQDRHGNKEGAYSLENSEDFIRTSWIKGSLGKYTFSIWVSPKEYNRKVNNRKVELNTLFAANLKPTPKGHQPWLGYSGIHKYIRLHYHPLNSHFDTGHGVMKYNQWSHLVGAFDGVTANIYLNGKMLSQKKASKTSPGSSSQYRVYIGSDTGGSIEYLSGKIDDARIYNRALSAKEVKALYDLEKPKK